MRQPKPLPLRGQGIASRSCATETTRHGLGEHAPPQHGAPNTAARPRCPLQTLQQRRHALARRPAHARRGRRRRRGRASARAQAGHPARRARRRRSGHVPAPRLRLATPTTRARTAVRDLRGAAGARRLARRGQDQRRHLPHPGHGPAVHAARVAELAVAPAQRRGLDPARRPGARRRRRAAAPVAHHHRRHPVPAPGAVAAPSAVPSVSVGWRRPGRPVRRARRHAARARDAAIVHDGPAQQRRRRRRRRRVPAGHERAGGALPVRGAVGAAGARAADHAPERAPAGVRAAGDAGRAPRVRAAGAAAGGAGPAAARAPGPARPGRAARAVRLPRRADAERVHAAAARGAGAVGLSARLGRAPQPARRRRPAGAPAREDPGQREPRARAAQPRPPARPARGGAGGELRAARRGGPVGGGGAAYGGLRAQLRGMVASSVWSWHTGV